MDYKSLLTPELCVLRDLFVSKGFGLRFVGGCVRDLYAGLMPNDIDMHTDATPDEQVDLYQKNNVRYIETGLKHGTLTVMLGGISYEITSLRIDTETDGRRAVVRYTKDWTADLGRRDFRFNSMSLGFDGDLMDPFNGLDDLRTGVVRFVGDPIARIREDYLRILRWYRFRARFDRHYVNNCGGFAYGDAYNYNDQEFVDYNEVIDAINKTKDMLSTISVERVWSEISKLLTNKPGFMVLADMCYNEVIDFFNLKISSPLTCNWKFELCDRTENVITLLSSVWPFTLPSILCKLKVSGKELKFAQFIDNYTGYYIEHSRELFTDLLTIDSFPKDWVIELAILRGVDDLTLEMLKAWEIPVFPVTGDDLIDVGICQGREIGRVLDQMKRIWARSDWMLNKTELLEKIPTI